MADIRTGPIDFASYTNGANTDNFTAATGPMPTAQFKEILVSIWLSALTTNAKARWGIRFSDDGTNWDTAAKLNVGAGYASTVGFTFGTVWTDITSVAGTTQKRWFQLGFMGLNNAGTAIESGQGELLIQSKPLVSRTIALGPIRAWCNSTTAVFIPLSGPIPASDVGEVRGTIEIVGATLKTGPDSRIGLTCGFQQANKPSDPADWTGTTTFGSQRSTNGITFGTAFIPVTGITKSHLRFGVNAVNIDAGGGMEVCQTSLIIDYRR